MRKEGTPERIPTNELLETLLSFLDRYLASRENTLEIARSPLQRRNGYQRDDLIAQQKRTFSNFFAQREGQKRKAKPKFIPRVNPSPRPGPANTTCTLVQPSQPHRIAMSQHE